MAKSKSLNVNIGANAAPLRTELAKANASLRGFSKTAKGIGASLGVYLGGSVIISAIGSSIRKIADFEEQMDKVAAVSRATRVEVEKLTKNALDLGAKSRYTAIQIGSMQEVLARLGFSSERIIQSTDAIRKLATAAGEELAPAAESLAKVMNSFQIEAIESERVANTMAESFSMSALNLEKFDVAMGNVGATANAAGFSLEETTALLGILVDNGIDASKAGTDLRKIFTSIAISGSTLNDELKKLKESEDKLTTSYDQFGQRALTSGIILSENIAKFHQLSGALADTTMELDKMSDSMADNLNTDLKLMESAFDGAIQKGEGMIGVFRGLVKLGTLMIDTNAFDMDFRGMGVEELTAKIKKHQNAITNITHNYDLGALSVSEFNEKIGHQNSIISEAEKRLKGLTAALQGIQSPLHEVINGMSVPLGDAFGVIEDLPIFKKQPSAPIPIIQGIKDQLKELSTAKDLATTTGEIISLNAQIERLKTKLEDLDSLGTGGGAMANLDKLTGITAENLPIAPLKTLAGTMKKVNVEFIQNRDMITGAMVQFDTMNEVILNTGAILREFAETSIVSFSEGIGDAISGVGNFGEGILNAMSSFMGNLGKQMIQLGIAKTILDKLSAALPGGVLIAAGAALTIASKAISNSFNKGIGGGSGGVSASRGGSESYGLSNSVATDRQPLKIEGEFKIKGTDLALSLERTNYRNSRTGG